MASSGRQLKPELLDLLPENNPLAVRSRRDLRKLNSIMGNAFILARRIEKNWPHGELSTVLDLGAGDGTASLAVARRLATRWQKVSLTLLDRQQLVSTATVDGLARLGWQPKIIVSDVSKFFSASQVPGFNVVIANLFLHHLRDEELLSLMRGVASAARLFIALEPRRSWRSWAASRCVGLLGCNSVTRHDAAVSADAGFSSGELTRLWPSRSGWQLRECTAGIFGHCFTALRHG
jgi:hypothetical protein